MWSEAVWFLQANVLHLSEGAMLGLSEPGIVVTTRVTGLLMLATSPGAVQALRGMGSVGKALVAIKLNCLNVAEYRWLLPEFRSGWLPGRQVFPVFG
jgi:hypothetical protein